MDAEPQSWIIPVGTHVVTRVPVQAADLPAGAAGMVGGLLADEGEVYAVSFPGGATARLRREDLAIRKHVHREGLEQIAEGPTQDELWQHVIYRCVIGSRAYGLAEDDSDFDRRGFYLPPAALHWSIAGVPEQLETDDHEECYWEIGKFVNLALKANPNILECLYTPLVEYMTPLAAELREMRGAFVSRMVYQTYNGYAMSQFHKMNRHLRTTGEMNWKHAMHLIRLLLSGIAALREGAIRVDVGEHREQLLAIRRGEMSVDDLEAWRRRLHREFDAALARSDLPERPDYGRANAFLVRARRSMV
ncbi:MAG: nucleotidyltransferase domain-containing protein [Armatimonadetes bacterium]|nr:nucleotidyltransferase domain-containing protein [Armatimonadota bacterium]